MLELDTCVADVDVLVTMRAGSYWFATIYLSGVVSCVYHVAICNQGDVGSTHTLLNNLRFKLREGRRGGGGAYALTSLGALPSARAPFCVVCGRERTI